MDTVMTDATKRGQNSAGTPTDDMGSQSKSIGKRGMDALDDMTGQARSAVSGASDSIIAYIRENPAKALGMAAAAGVVAYALLRALIPTRD